MKKYLLYIPLVLGMFGVASCSQDRDPKYHAPAEGSFVLNKPAMMNQEIILNSENTLEFSCSQPDYGFAATAAYSIQMSLAEAFTDFYTLTPLDENSAIISVKQSDVATGVCSLMGLDSEEAFQEAYPDGNMPVMPVYFRATCNIPGVESSAITSNTISYNYLKPYFAVPVPGYIYVIGNVADPNGENWIEPSEGNAGTLAEWRLFEDKDDIGSKIYKGSFEIHENPIFRFYTALTGWDADSYGTQEADSPIEFPEFTEGTFEHELVKGKGSFSFPNWTGGTMNMVVDMSNANQMTVTFSTGEIFVAKYIYVVGSITSDGGWKEPSESNASYYEDWRLVNSSDAPGVFTGSFQIPDDNLDAYFRFYTALTGWDDDSYGAQLNDESVDCSLTNGSFTGPYVPGKGSWHFNFPAAGTLEIAMDTDNTTVTINYVTD